jgi:hypothetical protein
MLEKIFGDKMHSFINRVKEIQNLQEGLLKQPVDLEVVTKEISAAILKRIEKTKNKLDSYKLKNETYEQRQNYGWFNIPKRFNAKLHFIGYFKFDNPYSGKQMEISVFLDRRLHYNISASMLRRDDRERYYRLPGGNELRQYFKPRSFCFVVFYPTVLNNIDQLQETIQHEIIHIIDPKQKLHYLKKKVNQAYDDSKTVTQRDFAYETHPFEYDAYLQNAYYRVKKFINIKKSNGIPDDIIFKELFDKIRLSAPKLLFDFLGISHPTYVLDPIIVRRYRLDLYKIVSKLKNKIDRGLKLESKIIEPELNFGVYNIKVKVGSGEWLDRGDVVAKNHKDAYIKFVRSSLGAMYGQDGYHSIEFDFDKTEKRKRDLIAKKEKEKQEEDEYIQSMWWNK